MKELEKISTSEWPKIWCSLNSWEFPKELQHIKPSWYDDEVYLTNNPHSRSNFIRPFMDEIEQKFTAKQLNRQWNIDRMTDEEHEAFWND